MEERIANISFFGDTPVPSENGYDSHFLLKSMQVLVPVLCSQLQTAFGIWTKRSSYRLAPFGTVVLYASLMAA